jgi:hypothetical protein
MAWDVLGWCRRRSRGAQTGIRPESLGLFEPNALLAAIDQQRLLHCSELDVELRAESLAAWLQSSLVQHEDFDAGRCFAALTTFLEKRSEPVRVWGSHVCFYAEYRGGAIHLRVVPHGQQS